MDEENKNQNIIIVDDDDLLTNMYTAKFNKIGVSSEVCKSGDALLERLKTNSQARAVILDLVIPGLDGLSTLKEIRNGKMIEGVPIIMLTNQNDDADIEEAKKLGVSGYIVKSAVTPSEVVSEVMKILNTKS